MQNNTIKHAPVSITQLPIVSSDVIAHKTDYYIFLTAIRNCSVFSNLNFSTASPYGFYRLDNYYKVNGREGSHLSRQSFDKCFNTYFNADGICELLYNGEFIAPLPTYLWDAFVSWLTENAAAREFNAYTRLFMWLYGGIKQHAASGFFQSVELLSKNLGMATKDISAKLYQLESGGWICRGSYNSIVGLARTYALGKKVLALASLFAYNNNSKKRNKESEEGEEETW